MKQQMYSVGRIENVGVTVSEPKSDLYYVCTKRNILLK